MGYADSGGGQVVQRQLIDYTGLRYALDPGGWRGSTRVLFSNGDLWYRSAIVFKGRRGQYWGCVGKVRANHVYRAVLSLWHPADTTL